MTNIFSRFLKDESAPRPSRYGLIAAILGVGIVAGLGTLKTALNGISSRTSAASSTLSKSETSLGRDRISAMRRFKGHPGRRASGGLLAWQPAGRAPALFLGREHGTKWRLTSEIAVLERPSGATAIEYGLIAAFIGVGVVVGLTSLRGSSARCSTASDHKVQAQSPAGQSPGDTTGRQRDL